MTAAHPLVIELPVARHIREFPTLSAAFTRDVVVLAYTCFGDLFLQDVATSQIAIAYLSPFELIPVASKSLSEAIARIEAEPRINADLLKPEKVALLLARLGPLCADEIYAPFPIPMLGGDDSVESYQKANLWAHVTFLTS